MRNLVKLLAGAVLLILIYATPMTGQTSGTAKGKKATGKEVPMGTIEIELFAQDAPKAVENFVKLADRKYFNGVLFHRVSKGFVIQGGDPTGTGAGGKSIWGKDFADELNPNAPSFKEGYKKGIVAMANKGPNTNSSQFFIMLADAPRMPKNYTIFGKVVKGTGSGGEDRGSGNRPADGTDGWQAERRHSHEDCNGLQAAEHWRLQGSEAQSAGKDRGGAPRTCAAGGTDNGKQVAVLRLPGNGTRSSDI